MDEIIKILCVDDETNVLNAIRRLFMDYDYVIHAASSGHEGFAVLEKEEIQIVISDYRMPGMDGVAFLKKVYQRWPDTIRIVLSGYADISVIVAAINEGHIYKFISKPWNDDELKMTVSHAIERYFLHKQNLELTAALKVRNDELLILNDKLENLVQERTDNLVFRSKIVVTYQNILNSIPAGIVGIDLSGNIVLCNSAWIDITGSGWHIMGQNIKSSFSKEIILFFEEVKTKGIIKMRFIMNGVDGILTGSLMHENEDQQGVICIFMRLDGLP
jgi:two-component system NtrC family sensor kinase